MAGVKANNRSLAGPARTYQRSDPITDSNRGKVNGYEKEMQDMTYTPVLNKLFGPAECHNLWNWLRTVKLNTRVELWPHICRYSYGTQLLRRSGNLELLQDQLGHSSPVTTRVYAKTLKASSIKNLEKLNFV